LLIWPIFHKRQEYPEFSYRKDKTISGLLSQKIRSILIISHYILVSVFCLRNTFILGRREHILRVGERAVPTQLLGSPSRDDNFTRGYPTRRVRVCVWNFTRGYEYGYKISPAGRARVKIFTRGYPTGTRNTKNNLVNSYHSQILCLIFLWLYKLNRGIGDCVN